MTAAVMTKVPSIHRPDRPPGWVARDEFASSLDMLAVSTMSYRQLDYWTRRGYLLSHTPRVGSGYQHRWDGIEQRVGEAMKRLIDVGIAVDEAALLARAAVVTGENVQQYKGVTITVMVVA